MNILDTRTIMIAYMITNALSVVVMTSLWRQNRRLPGLRFWLADFGMQFTGIALIVLRGKVPDFLSMTVSNTLILGGSLLLFMGLEKYSNRVSAQWFNFSFLAVFFATQTYFTLVQQSLQFRNINIAFFLMLFSFQTAWLLLRRADRIMRKDALNLGLILTGFGVLSIIRIFVDLSVHPGNDFFKSGLYDSIILMTYQTLNLSLTFSLFLLVNRRLNFDLKNEMSGLSLAVESLRVSEDKFSKAFQTSPYAITITRILDGKFIDVNDSFTSITRISREAALANSSLGLNLWVNPEDRQGVVSALLAGNPVDGQEFLFHRNNGEILTGLFSARMILVNDDPCILASIDDITERKRAEEKLKEYSEHLEEMVAERTSQLREAQQQLVLKEKLAVLGQLAGGVGHELRNPLGVISSAIYYLKLIQPDADDKIQKYHGMIEQEVHNSEKIINDLLDFARGVTAQREAVAVTELIGHVLGRFPAPSSVQVELKLPGDLSKVYADPRQVEQVLGNLVVNAYQAMPTGGMLSVTGEQSSAGSEQSSIESEKWVWISVKDTGTGISAENLPKLFEPLFTTKVTGIGLGLAVCKKLVEANAGRIAVQSEAGEGSTFTVYLPMEDQ